LRRSAAGPSRATGVRVRDYYLITLDKLIDGLPAVP
jgi:hypothetical protein